MKFLIPLLLSIGLASGVTVPPVFGDHMVLQRSHATPIWGTADPGEKLTLNIDTVESQTVADASGRWKTSLDLDKLAEGPHELRIQGVETLTFRDVLVGQVWLCSGQSNMAWILSRTSTGPSEIPKSKDRRLREFVVATTTSDRPASSLRGSWVLSRPDSAGDFSALGYHFGRALIRELGCPVGIINASWGGTPILGWISEPSIEENPIVRKQAEEVLRKAGKTATILQDFEKQFALWKQTTAAEQSASTSIASSDWVPISLPGELNLQNLKNSTTAGIPGSAGRIQPGDTFWLKRSVDIPPDRENLSVRLELGAPPGPERLFWNGKLLHPLVERVYSSQLLRVSYLVPGEIVRAGSNELAMQILSVEDNPSYRADPGEMRAGTIPLEGCWLIHHEESARHVPPPAIPSEIAPLAKCLPGRIFNGMIHPLVGLGLAGVLWYQGEADVNQPAYYREAFPLLISDWRACWDRPELPFFYCQLARFLPRKNTPDESTWAEFRVAQSEALQLPETGQAVLIDTGEANDIHSSDKTLAADRLARLALAKVYHKDIVWSGPVPGKPARDGRQLRISFDGAPDGLVAHPNQEGKNLLQGFALKGSQGAWQMAEAKIEGRDVVLKSEGIDSPAYVRYGWADNPEANLYNHAGLPAAPFQIGPID